MGRPHPRQLTHTEKRCWSSLPWEFTATSPLRESVSGRVDRTRRATAPVPAVATRVTAETCGAANWLQSWVINPSPGGKVMVGLLGSDLCLDATDTTQLRAVKCSSSQQMQEWRWNASSAMLASAGNSGCPGGAEYGCCVSELGSGSYKPGDVVNLYGCCDPQPPCTNQQIVLKPESTAAGSDGHRLVIERAGLCISVQHRAPAPPAPAPPALAPSAATCSASSATASRRQRQAPPPGQLRSSHLCPCCRA